MTTTVAPNASEQASVHPKSAPDGASRPSARRDLWLGIAIALGILVRVLPALMYDFPLNDGGLFYQMAVELKQSGFALPTVTAYNGDNIPFAYAPLGFYAAAVLGRTPDGILAVVRWLPIVVSCLMLPAFVLLARRLLPSERSVVAATFAFAVLPRSFLWMIMGGGLTRSLGMLFSILALWQAHLLYTTKSWRFVPTTAVLASLTVLSHLGTAPFCAASIALFWLAFGRTRHGIAASVAVAALTILLTAPWWATVIAQHGLAPFHAAQASGGSVLSGSEARWEVRIALAKLTMGITGEPLFPIIQALGILGALVELTRRRLLLPAWWTLIVLADIRAPGSYASLPISLLAGVGVTDALIPLLARWQRPIASAKPDRLAAAVSARRWTGAVLAALLLYASAAALERTPSLGSELPYLAGIDSDTRTAMRWVASSTPSDARVLVVTGAPWAADRIAEWFPVLARRKSVATVQGSEWLEGGEYTRRFEAYEALANCAQQDVACIERWASVHDKPFDYVYVPKTIGKKGMPGHDCCSALLASALATPRYTRVYDGSGAAVFARR